MPTYALRKIYFIYRKQIARLKIWVKRYHMTSTFLWLWKYNICVHFFSFMILKLAKKAFRLGFFNKLRVSKKWGIILFLSNPFGSNVSRLFVDKLSMLMILVIVAKRRNSVILVLIILVIFVILKAWLWLWIWYKRGVLQRKCFYGNFYASFLNDDACCYERFFRISDEHSLWSFYEIVASLMWIDSYPHSC